MQLCITDIPTQTDRDRQRQTETDRDKHGEMNRSKGSADKKNWGRSLSAEATLPCRVRSPSVLFSIYGNLARGGLWLQWKFISTVPEIERSIHKYLRPTKTITP